MEMTPSFKDVKDIRVILKMIILREWEGYYTVLQGLCHWGIGGYGGYRGYRGCRGYDDTLFEPEPVIDTGR